MITNKIRIAIDAMKFLKEKLFNGIFKEYVGNFDTAIEALEKQLPQKPVIAKNEIVCPRCRTLVGSSPYCRYCGQALDQINDEAIQLTFDMD